MLQAFITCIRPILEFLEYCDVWNITHVNRIDLVENMPRNFTKRIPTTSSFSYTERLAPLWPWTFQAMQNKI